MENRKFLSIAIKAIALLFVFSALPLLASAQQINNFEYVRYDTLRYRDIFRWDTVSADGEIQMQVRGGGVSQVWLNFTVLWPVERLSNGKTQVGISPVQNVPGTELEYRVRVGNGPWSNIIKLDFN